MRPRPPTPWTFAGCVVTLAVAVSSCAVATQESAVPVPDTDVPFSLLLPDDPTDSTDPPIRGIATEVYLVSEEGLVRVPRTVGTRSVDDLIDELAAPLEPNELDAGLRSILAVDGGDPLVTGGEVAGTIATVDLSPVFTALDSDSQLLAIAQLVLTLTSQPEIGEVGFTIARAPTEVPRADGTTTGDPLRAADYTSLVVT